MTIRELRTLIAQGQDFLIVAAAFGDHETLELAKRMIARYRDQLATLLSTSR